MGNSNSSDTSSSSSSKSTNNVSGSNPAMGNICASEKKDNDADKKNQASEVLVGTEVPCTSSASYQQRMNANRPPPIQLQK
jgi:hypothetical protein